MEEAIKKLTEKLGGNINEDFLRDYLKKRGNISDLRFLEGGFRSAAVIAFSGIVVKMDHYLPTAKTQRGFLSEPTDDLRSFLPRVAPDITYHKGIAIWDMEDVSRRFLHGGSRFNTTRPKRDNQEPVISHKQPTKECISFLHDQGAKNIPDLVEHYLYIASLLGQQKLSLDVQKGPKFNLDKVGDRLEKLASFEKSHPLYGLVSKEKSQELIQCLEVGVDYLTNRTKGIIHGDYKPSNTVDGAMVDPSPRFGHPVEDATRFLTDPLFGFSDNTVLNYLEKFAVFMTEPGDDHKQVNKEVMEIFPASYAVNIISRFSAAVQRDLSLESQQKRTWDLRKSVDKSLTYFSGI